MFIDNDFPKLLGAELYRPHPAYIVEMACEPIVVHDFTKQPGQTVQLDRYRFFGAPGTKSNRERTQDQTIGTANSRSIVKDKVLVSLREYTGPADPNNANLPSTFKIARETLMTAQRLLLDTGNLNMFHQSIGSLTLLDDYRRWRDRVFLDELFKAESRGKSSDTQGGYYYPENPTKATSTSLPAYSASQYASERFKFNVKTDLLEVVKGLRKRNVPVFADGYYRCIADPSFMKDMRADSGFREVARYPGMGQPNPLMSAQAPNAAVYGGGQFGQAQFVGGEPVMPSGFVFEGVRFFESTNMPSKTISVDIGDGNGAQTRDTPPALFFGPQSVGVGIGGPNAQVLINNNDDFSRFIILIWQLYAGFANLNKDFTTVGFTVTEAY
tara:strand:+ start:2107 stop:3258 length:1152 start_codon:yes stop_codon:yes gene_type:complete